MVRKKQLAAKSKVVHGEEPDSSELGKSLQLQKKGQLQLRQYKRKRRFLILNERGKTESSKAGGYTIDYRTEKKRVAEQMANSDQESREASPFPEEWEANQPAIMPFFLKTQQSRKEKLSCKLK